MMATLDRVREDNETSQESKTYYSIIRTGQLVSGSTEITLSIPIILKRVSVSSQIPYDSAIFLSTDKLPNDTEHIEPASMILLKKRIRVRTISTHSHDPT